MLAELSLKMAGLSGLAIIGFAAVLAWALGLMKSNRTWRQCTRCERYFDDEGYITDYPGPIYSSPVPGVCPDCQKELEFRG